MDKWERNYDIAIEHLNNATDLLKEGQKQKGCLEQKLAGKYGVIASKSLIKAFKENGSTDDLDNIKSGLNKWKELRDFCE